MKSPWEIIEFYREEILQKLLYLRPPEVWVIADGRVVMVRGRPEEDNWGPWLNVALRYSQMRAPAAEVVTLLGVWPHQSPRRPEQRVLIMEAIAPREPDRNLEERFERLQRLMSLFGAEVVLMRPVEE